MGGLSLWGFEVWERMGGGDHCLEWVLGGCFEVVRWRGVGMIEW